MNLWRSVRVLKQACYLLMSRFFLEKFHVRVAVEQERALRGHL